MIDNKKVLIIDDDPDILEALELVFQSARCTVETTTKGENTYSVVNTFKPDIIILDVLLSGKDGRTICKKLKKDKTTKHIPIIMISAHPNAGASTKAVGADEFLAKPFNIKELLSKTEALIRQSSRPRK
ncbi:MAG: response regulator [bacterium]|nr:response regulator [bacterium]